MSWSELLFGHPLRSDQEHEETIGVARGVAALGLDALASASYGPEAALTVLAASGALAFEVIGPIILAIVAVLIAVYLSYRQTIAAYPGGGGSFTVASQNLGRVPGMLAASALGLDYILNVAVAIAAGVGAVVSVFPSLLPHTLAMCLVILAILAIVNLRGIRQAGLILLAPTWLFVAMLSVAIVIGVVKAIIGAEPVVAPPEHAATASALGAWTIIRAFANGTTAMTGVESVSNGVPVFREPTIQRAQRTLGVIVAILIALLIGIAYLSRAFQIGATEPNTPGYQSVLSQMLGAVMGRGVFYTVAMASILLVLCLSANTSFAGFPRVCRLLALDDLLPPSFAHRGSRLVYSHGIVALTLLSAVLLVAFGGVTDRLIPLFAIGALSAFTLSQWGMVAHWHRSAGRHRRKSLVMNAVGATATSLTVLIVLVSKFTDGAWITLLVIGGFIAIMQVRYARNRRIARVLGKDTAQVKPLSLEAIEPPIVVVPLARLDRVGRKALMFALTVSHEVEAVEVLTDDPDRCDLRDVWDELVVQPVRRRGLRPPTLTTLPSEYRELFTPLLAHIREILEEHPHRHVAVVVPELVERRWYHRLFRTRPMLLKALLRYRGGARVVIIDTPWHLRE